MPYTNEEGGRLNNFASEPQVYKAEPPNARQKRNFIFLGILGATMVGALIFVAYNISSVS